MNVFYLTTRTDVLLQVFIPPLEQINIDDILKVRIFSMTSVCCRFELDKHILKY